MKNAGSAKNFLAHVLLCLFLTTILLQIVAKRDLQEGSFWFVPNVEKENAFTRVWDAHVAKQPAGNNKSTNTTHGRRDGHPKLTAHTFEVTRRLAGLQQTDF